MQKYNMKLAVQSHQPSIVRTLVVAFCLISLSACQTARTSNTPSSDNMDQQQSQSTTIDSTVTPTPLPPADMHLTVVAPSGTKKSSEITVDLNGSQLTQPLSGIAVRLLFATSPSTSDPQLPKAPFTVPAELTQAGWTVAVNRLTYDSGETAAELALIATNPQGLQLTEPTILGTIQPLSTNYTYRPTFDASATQVVTKSAQAVPLNLSEMYPTAQ